MNLLCFYANVEPLNFEEARKKKKWVQVMDEEIQAIEKRYGTWLHYPKAKKLLELNGCSK